jgi:hypothetical protein
MPQYAAPGVYVEEVSSGAKPIAGVGTSTAGFIGVVDNAALMPLKPGRNARSTPKDNPTDFYTLAAAGAPVLITSWEGFKTSFGDFQDGNRVLANAVYGFFNNGGTRCWVARVAPATAAAAEARNEKATAARPLTVSIAADALRGVLEAFKAIDEIALVAAPGVIDTAAQTAIVNHCENEYLQDRFAILDGQPAPTALTPDLISGALANSSYAAIYYPWIDVGAADANGNILYMPPSGHIAGIYARVDAIRGVHKAPANENIRGALDVLRAVTKEDQVGLNPSGINVIRRFGGNITIWGARTFSADPEWNYINVRRLFLFLRESIDEGTQWVVFEPNDLALWAKIRRNISAFLTNVWRAGALFGATAEEAFYVRCDETLNPPDVRALGQVVTEIGVAVVRPAEFVIFRISQWSGPSQ